MKLTLQLAGFGDLGLPAGAVPLTTACPDCKVTIVMTLQGADTEVWRCWRHSPRVFAQQMQHAPEGLETVHTMRGGSEVQGFVRKPRG